MLPALRSLIVIGISALACACGTFAVKEHPAGSSIRLAEKTTRIALLGFYPFTSRVTGSSVSGNVRTTTYVATLDEGLELKRVVPFGTPIQDLPVVERKEITREEAIRIVRIFVGEVKRSGLKEMSQLIEVTAGKHYIKKRDVEYYVIGIHLPAFARSKPQGLGFLKIFLTLFSFGLYPYDTPLIISSKFVVLDRDLMPVKTFEYNGTYWRRMGWLPGKPAPGFTKFLEDPVSARWNASPYPGAIEADILTFARDFSDHLRGHAKTEAPEKKAPSP